MNCGDSGSSKLFREALFGFCPVNSGLYAFGVR